MNVQYLNAQLNPRPETEGHKQKRQPESLPFFKNTLPQVRSLVCLTPKPLT